MADEYRLAVASNTPWRWDIEAVVDALPQRWPGLRIVEDYPIAGEPYPVFTYIPDDLAGCRLEVSFHESGQLIELGYGSPQRSAEFVEWLLSNFPPPQDAQLLLYEWGRHPTVTAETTADELLAVGP